MLKPLDKLLASALNNGNFIEAEQLIEAGADINALNYDDIDDWYSVLQESVVITDIPIRSILEFAIQHGLDPKLHNGHHVLLALFMFRYTMCDEQAFEDYKAFLDLDIDFSTPFPVWSEDSDFNIVDYCEDRMNDLFADVIGQSDASMNALLKEVIEAKIRGLPYDQYHPINHAVGHKVQRILMYEAPDSTSKCQILHKGLITFKDWRRWIVLDLGELALVMFENIWAYVKPIKHLDFNCFTDISEYFPDLIDQKITEGFFSDMFKGEYGFNIDCHFANGRQIRVGCTYDNVVTIASSQSKTTGTDSNQRRSEDSV